jgi:hypothetical protein
MLKASLERNYHYYNNVQSLKRQTIREDGAQSHGPLRALTGMLANRFDSRSNLSEFARQPGCQSRKGDNNAR